MRPKRSWFTILLSALQTILLALPFVLHYYGSHRMGAHRHFKVRSDAYLSGILSSRNLTIAAIFLAVVLLLWLCYILVSRERRKQISLLPTVLGIALSISLILLLIVPSTREILIFPWLLLCVAVIWLLQLVKLLVLHLQKNQR